MILCGSLGNNTEALLMWFYLKIILTIGSHVINQMAPKTVRKRGKITVFGRISYSEKISENGNKTAQTSRFLQLNQILVPSIMW